LSEIVNLVPIESTKNDLQPEETPKKEQTLQSIGMKLCAGYKTRLDNYADYMSNGKIALAANGLSGFSFKIENSFVYFRSLECKQIVENLSRVCKNCQNLKKSKICKVKIKHNNEHQESKSNSEEALDYSKQAYDLIKDYPEHRYVKLLKLQIAYGIHLSKTNKNIANTNGQFGKINAKHGEYTVYNNSSFRWDSFKEEKEFFITLLSKSSKKVRKLLRGDTSQGTLNAHFPIPHESTFKGFFNSFIPKGETLTVSSCNAAKRSIAKSLLQSYANNLGISRKGISIGLSFDGIDIAPFVDIAKTNNGDVLVGFHREIGLQEFLEKALDKWSNSLCNHIMQFFIMTLDGIILMPIDSLPYSKGLDSSQILKWIEDIETDLDVKTTFISCDGDIFDLEKKWESHKGENQKFIFRDSDHVTKNGRNAFLKQNSVTYIEDNCTFGFTDLEYLSRDTNVPDQIRGNISKLLKYINPRPSGYDKLRLKPVKLLLDTELINYLINIDERNSKENEKLSAENISKAKAMGIYFKLLNCVFYLWEFKDDKNINLAVLPTVEERIAFIDETIKKFKFHTQSQFPKQCESLVRNFNALKESNISIKYTILVSRMVENFFSYIRNINKHPSIAEYLRISLKASVLFVLEHSNDNCFFPLDPNETEIGSYTKQSGVNISWIDFSKQLKEHINEYRYLTKFKNWESEKKFQDNMSVFSKSLIPVFIHVLNRYRRTKSLSQTKFTDLFSETFHGFIHTLLIYEGGLTCPFCKAPFKTFGCFHKHLKNEHEFDKNISHINQYPKLELSVIEDINLKISTKTNQVQQPKKKTILL